MTVTNHFALGAQKYPLPTKPMPALTRGKKLTRAGLLLRYHSFLANELASVSLELYGDRDYGTFYTPLDSFVQRALHGRGPIHQQSKLPARAKKIFKAIGINSGEARP